VKQKKIHFQDQCMRRIAWGIILGTLLVSILHSIFFGGKLTNIGRESDVPSIEGFDLTRAQLLTIKNGGLPAAVIAWFYI
jgi:hypothetical protein